MHRGPSFHVRAAGCLLVALLGPATAQTVVQWQTNVSGDWFTAANWTPAVVPDSPSPTVYRAVVSVIETPL